MRYPPTNVKVVHVISRHIPKPGDKFTIKDFSCLEGMGSTRVAEIARMPFLVVEDVLPIPLGEEGHYEWHYEIYAEGNIGPLMADSLNFNI